MKEKEKDDPLRKVADQLRGRKGVETRSAVMGEHRVDFFRSKVRESASLHFLVIISVY